MDTFSDVYVEVLAPGLGGGVDSGLLIPVDKTVGNMCITPMC